MTIRTQFIARVLPRPIVRLQDRATGRQFWVMNVHNAPWEYQEKRNQATAVQIAKIAELEKSGLPVFYIGDFNEKRTILCKVLRRTELVSPYGGRLNGQGECIEPRAADAGRLDLRLEVREVQRVRVHQTAPG